MSKAEEYLENQGVKNIVLGISIKNGVIELSDLLDNYLQDSINEVTEEGSLKVGTFLLQKVTRNDFNNSDNIVFITNELGEGTDVDISKVFKEAY